MGDELRRKSQGENDHSEDESDNESDISASEAMSPKLSLQRSKAKSPEKEKAKRSWKKLNLIAQTIDVENNVQLKKKLKVDIKFIDNGVVDELEDCEKVDVTNHSSLLDQLNNDEHEEERDIDRLCDFKSLRQGRRGSSDSRAQTDKEQTKSYKSKKKAELGLGDISSNSEENSEVDQDNSEDDENQFQGFKTENDLAKNAVLAQTSDEDGDKSDINGIDSNDSDASDKPVKDKKKEKKEKLVDRASKSDSEEDKPK